MLADIQHDVDMHIASELKTIDSEIPLIQDIKGHVPFPAQILCEGELLVVSVHSLGFLHHWN